MNVIVQLFGALGEAAPGAEVNLELPAQARVAEAREALLAHARSHWSDPREGLLARSAFASDSRVLREHEPIPTEGRLAVLPPVSGG